MYRSIASFPLFDCSTAMPAHKPPDPQTPKMKKKARGEARAFFDDLSRRLGVAPLAAAQDQAGRKKRQAHQDGRQQRQTREGQR